MLVRRMFDVFSAIVRPMFGACYSIVGNIEGPLMLQFAEMDKRVNGSWPAYEDLLKKKNVDYQAYVYPGVKHGFHNDSIGRYYKEAAELAWSRTLSFFGEHLT